jgi:hypothetical protein
MAQLLIDRLGPRSIDGRWRQATRDLKVRRDRPIIDAENNHNYRKGYGLQLMG